jgi:tetraacyldisaccharide 4'-kinase
MLRAKRLNGIVISVGNLTVGGTGKTPMVMWLARKLYQNATPVGILSRGYRGIAGSHPILRGNAAKEQDKVSPALHSDETWMMERRLGDRVRLGVGADRYAHGRAMELAGIEWFLLDDGFQHLQLDRDANIVLLDGRNPFGNGHLLPAGDLREPLSALRRADLVVITRCAAAPEIEATVRRHCSAPIFYATTELDSVEPCELSDVQAAPAEWFGAKVFAFAAIGNPQAFFDDVTGWGMTLAGQKGFSDHHRFLQAEAEAIEVLASDAGAEALVCTDKDYFNLLDVRFRKFPLFVCTIRLRIAEEEAFWSAVCGIIELKNSTDR